MRGGMKRLGVLFLGVVVATTGCLGGTGQVLAGCEDLMEIRPVFAGTNVAGHLQRAPGQAVPVLFWVENVADTGLEVRLETAPEAASYLDPEGGIGDWLDIDVPKGEQRLLAANLDEAMPNGSVQVSFHAFGTQPNEVKGTLCDYSQERTQWVTLAEPIQPNATAEEGQGVLVRTVGFWMNGTSFYTNHEGFHNRTDLPRDYVGNYTGSDPLKVYIYDESSQELPDRYNESGYSTTIPGFNEALKTLPTMGARFTAFPPEQGYTREGNEEHPLYGDPLAFYIEALEVRTIPCEVPQPVCEVPGQDDAPEPPAAAWPPVPLSI